MSVLGGVNWVSMEGKEGKGGGYDSIGFLEEFIFCVGAFERRGIEAGIMMDLENRIEGRC